MAVFGVIPRSFYEFETANLTAVNGAADRDLTVFETAMRLRQIALNAVQQAIQEDRLARASHTRPHQLDLSQLVPGTTTVDLHRDGTWRGPAVLLEVDQSEGTAIIKYQGKPYLVSLRFIRPSQGIFYNIDTQVGTGLYKLMRMTEAMQPYKQQVLGYKQILTHAGFQ